MKKALLTGVTGQDGSYLAELLLEKGYEVHGVIRRASTFNTSRIEHLYKDPHINGVKFFLHYGDLDDATSIRKVVFKIYPDELYNLGAQSHVRVSFDMPEYTMNITGSGTLRVLEIIRDFTAHTGKQVKFYQASSSEMFGSAPAPQNEKTAFHPRSPYGCAKVFAHYSTVNYREAYGLFAVNGILFNHETVAAFMPMFVKQAGETGFDIKPICEIVPFDENMLKYQSRSVTGIQVWDKNQWVDVTYASAYPHDVTGNNKKPRFINSRSGAFMATSSHVAFMADGSEKKTGDIEVGDQLEKMELPAAPRVDPTSPIIEEEAELMGMMVGDGFCTSAKRGIGVHGKFTNSSAEMRAHFDEIWRRITGGSTRYHPNHSGFNTEKIVGQLVLNGGNDWLRRLDMYNKDRTKRVPKIILNAPPEIMIAFLRGYNLSDGLKANPCTYDFKNFKTNSAVLALGLWYLISQTTRQAINLSLEVKEDGRIFYSLNLLSPVDNALKEGVVRGLVEVGISQRQIYSETGISRTFIRNVQYGGNACVLHHLRKNPLEVKKIIEMPHYQGWFYDLETSSGSFHCGVGTCHVHNSPRRGETFVTRKITRGIARIKAGLDKKIYLGNLDARRDWGYAPEYVEAMWQMLQEPEPEDYVIGTGETHSVKEFLVAAFTHAGMPNWEEYVEIDPFYYRPAEVLDLVADPTKAREKLGWQAKTTFSDLAKIMVDADIKSIEASSRDSQK